MAALTRDFQISDDATLGSSYENNFDWDILGLNHGI